MNPDPAPAKPTLLDPIGAIIYYLCVTHALKVGWLGVPSSEVIRKMLRFKKEKVNARSKPADPHVWRLWNDLKWMDHEGLLFHEVHEPGYVRSFTPHPLSQRVINDRINKFHPGFAWISPKRRCIVKAELVENVLTAARLIALKDLYYFNAGQVPQKLLLEFLKTQSLVSDADEFYRFLQIMRRIQYIGFSDLRAEEQFSDSLRDKHLLVEPGGVFRNQDMYLELRALDYFSQRGPSTKRRTLRKQLHERAKEFALAKRAGK